MKKKVDLPAKPKRAGALSADEWVQGARDAGAGQETERMSRLTLDLPAWLHREFKADCARRGVRMVAELRRMLTERYGAQAPKAARAKPRQGG